MWKTLDYILGDRKMTDEEMADKYAQNLEKELMKEYEEHSEYGQTPYLATIPTPHVKQAFLAGLKAGRPQWHKVADGDLPKAYQKCYFIYSNSYGEDNKVIFSKYNINILTGIYAFFLDEETGEETTDPCFYDDINDDEIGLEEVYAWKEIVLPELPKESE
jgi:hypothetical protein